MRELTPAGVVAWLDTPAGRAWRRARRSECPGGMSWGTWLAALMECNPPARTSIAMSGPVRPEDDPCGRPPLALQR